MCGFTGFFTPSAFSNDVDSTTILRRMAKAITHRGPDSDGYWVDSNSGIGLGHRRLSIVDLSPSGAQPMKSYSGRYVVAFNGEIYNFQKLKLELIQSCGNSIHWIGESDTEILLNCIDFWGINIALDKIIGMFSFALWDTKSKELTLVRDRMGEKPLYYGWQGNGINSTFLFGSDLASFRQHPSFIGEIDRDSLAQFMCYGYVGGAMSIYSGIKKLLPGHFLTLETLSNKQTVKQYWSVRDVAFKGINNPFKGTPNEAVAELEHLLSDAVKHQMVADVPLGAFLSGGIDSSTIVSIMQAQSMQPVRTFTIGFNETNFDEAVYAKEVASHLKTDHTELYITSSEALGVIPELSSIYSEPFADSSQIPTYLVSKLAKQHVTVSLSGDAGDEVFCGYNRYLMTHNLWNNVSRAPLPLRKFASYVLVNTPTTFIDKFGVILNMTHTGDKIHKGASLLDSTSVEELYQKMISFWNNPEEVVIGTTKNISRSTRSSLDLDGINDIDYMMLSDMLNYLPDDILVKVDRAAMGVSLETRVPFLDQRIVEFAWSLPLQYKLNNGVTKWPIRQILNKYVPKKLTDRPKMGFGIPIASWLRGPLRDWAESLISVDRLVSEGYFNSELIRACWLEHLSGKRNWQYRLWNVLMFQAWLDSTK